MFGEILGILRWNDIRIWPVSSGEMRRHNYRKDIRHTLLLNVNNVKTWHIPRAGHNVNNVNKKAFEMPTIVHLQVDLCQKLVYEGLIHSQGNHIPLLAFETSPHCPSVFDHHAKPLP
jgi:hypothetical protein